MGFKVYGCILLSKNCSAFMKEFSHIEHAIIGTVCLIGLSNCLVFQLPPFPTADSPTTL